MSPRLPIRLLAAQSDRRLVELVESGHERAFEVLVHRYRRQLLRYCGRLGLSDSRAEDALQQSFLRAWLSLQRGAGVRELKPWLYRIVHNTAVNVMRSSRQITAPLTDVAEITLVGDVEKDLEQRIAVRETLADVAALPTMQRDAILLSAVDGRSHEEVASALGLTNGAVRGLLYRARETLRSAAAALVPPPLLAWAAGGAGRAAPAASRLAELSGGAGGSEAGGALLKGVAVALSTAAAAGAVFVPLAHRRSPTPASAVKRGASPAGGTAAAQASRARLDARVGAAGQLAAMLPGEASARRHVTLSSHGRRGSGSRLDGHTGPRRGDSGSRSGGSDGGSETARSGRGGSPVSSSAQKDGSRDSGSSSSHGGDGSLVASTGAERSGSGGPGSGFGSSGSGSTGSGSGSSSSGDSHGTGSGDAGAAGREAEAARERSEREAEAMREREAQAAAVPTPPAGTDS